MKLSTFTRAVIPVLVIAFATSCGTSHPASRYPDHREYPERYPRDQRSTHRLPPGHEKKVHGQRSARVYAPGQRKKYGYRYPLIIVRRPGMDIRRSRDGRYYYANSDGFYYWQGYDKRFYLDDRHLSQIDYDHNVYEDWRGRGRNNSNRHYKGR